MMNKLQFLFVCFSVFCLCTCREGFGDPLFDMIYPPQDIQIQAGISPIQSQVFEFPNLPNNYVDFLDASGHTADEVVKIVPLFARVESLDGLDFGFLNTVSVRICPVGPEQCTLFDEVFYLDDLYRRNWTILNLDPGLKDVKELLSGIQHKMEVVFTSSQVTPYNLDVRFEVGYRAVK